MYLESSLIHWKRILTEENKTSFLRTTVYIYFSFFLTVNIFLRQMPIVFFSFLIIKILSFLFIFFLFLPIFFQRETNLRGG